LSKATENSDEHAAVRQYLKALEHGCVDGDSTYEDTIAARAKEMEKRKSSCATLSKMRLHPNRIKKCDPRKFKRKIRIESEGNDPRPQRTYAGAVACIKICTASMQVLVWGRKMKMTIKFA